MGPAEWNQVGELFHAALAKSGDQRVLLLDQACGSGTLLRQAVEELLKEYESAGNFLSEPLLDVRPRPACADVIAPNQRFERFILLEMLGRGGMGEVWSARDTELDRSVALKFLRAETASEVYSAHIAREAKAASALNHPNIVTIHEVVRSEGCSAIVMELVQGSSLAKLRGTSLPIAEVLSIGAQIAKALTAAHANGIIHGDIKPENIILRDDGYVKVLDFGLARRVAIETIAGAHGPIFGTLRYMSPEQATGESLTPASDVFSFGLVLFELATGRRAFADESPLDALRATLTQDPPAPASVNPRVPAALNSLLLAMLAKDPGKRSSAKQAAQLLEDEAARQNRATALDGAIVSQPPPGLRKQHQKLVWIGAFLVLAAAIAWIGFLQMRKPAAERIASSGLPEFTIHPLTAQPGWELYPALSPDGKSVAFTSRGDLKQPQAIYLKRFDSEAPQLLFKPSNGWIGALAWSPDKSKLAFKTQPGLAGEIWIIPSSGGDPVKVTNLENGNLSSSIDWSPDGSRLVFSDCWPNFEHLAIFSLDLRSSHKQRLTEPPLSGWGDWDPRYSPDGTQIAFKRVSGFWRDTLCVMPAEGGSIRAITGGSKSIWGHAWWPGGNALVVSRQGSSDIQGIWRYPLQPGSKPQRISEGNVDSITPTTARLANRLAWVDQTEDTNIYRIPVSGHVAPQKLIASTRHDQSASYASDGRIAFASDRSGNWEIWIASGDGSHSVQATTLSGFAVGHPRWSPDNRYIAFESLASGYRRIVVMKCQAGTAKCEQPVPLTVAREPDPFPETKPSWSSDGAAIYFSSNRTGRDEIWKQSWPPSGPAIQMTHHGGLAPMVSSDGRWLYYEKPSSFWRLNLTHENSATPSSEQIVLGWKDLVTSAWTLTPSELLFFSINGALCDIRGYGLRTGKLRNVANGLQFQVPFQTPDGLEVSADGRWLLFSQLDRFGSNIIVADFE